MAEIAGAEPPRAGAQRRDRHQHPPRQHRAGEDRDHEAERDQKRDPHQLVADRRQRLRGRLLEQHEPAELRHRARRRQHRMAVGVGARGQRRAVGLISGGDLRQLRRDPCRPPGPWRSSPAPGRWHRPHRRSRPCRPGRRRGNRARKRRSISATRDAGVEAGMRHRDRHEGPLAAEIGRREADAAVDGLGEAEVAGKIGVAVDRDLGARQPQLLAALRR